MFMARFAEAVRSGEKRQTVRPWPKSPKYLPRCLQLESWRMWSDKPYRSKQIELATVQICEVNLIRLKAKEFARADGFKDLKQMKWWFIEAHGLPFTGFLIKAFGKK